MRTVQPGKGQQRSLSVVARLRVEFEVFVECPWVREVLTKADIGDQIPEHHWVDDGTKVRPRGGDSDGHGRIMLEVAGKHAD